ncbi:MAG: acetyl-CoA C-acetyltransferase [Bdellovibrionota bacterium]
MKKVCIVSATRTPIGSFMGSLSGVSAPELGAIAISSAVEKSKIPAADISEVYMGCVLTSAMGQAPARQAALKAGLPESIPCTTVGKVCGSGLKSVMLAAQAIASGDAQVVVAGGMENMSQAPYALQKARTGLRMGHEQMVDTMIKDGLWDVYNDYHMGNAAELCARECKITREDQDRLAKQSYERALAAQKNQLFKDEITPVEIQDRKKGTIKITDDEEPAKVHFDKIPELRPVFDKDGTVTAANASSLNDGAAALVLCSEEYAKKNQLEPLAWIAGQSQAAKKPEWFTTAPADAISKLLEKISWQSQDVDFYEINEAFAVVSLAVNQLLKLDESKVNVRGGAVALGHPIGASGARILVTLLHTMKQENKHKGIASLCIGGGEAVALGVER